MYATRQALGSLYRAETLSTDPAHTLAFSGKLITTTRAALITKLEDKVPDSEKLPGIFNGILKTIVRGYDDQDPLIKSIDERIDQVFRNESMAKYGLEIFRDALITESLIPRWKLANNIYIRSPASWALSNDHLVDIGVQLHEILVRHDLMQFPKGEMFSLDESDTTAATLSRVAKALAEESERE